MLISHGVKHLRVQSDDGHHFLFDIIPEGRGRQLVIGNAQWSAGHPPFNSVQVLERASLFASVCAQDFGLI